MDRHICKKEEIAIYIKKFTGKKMLALLLVFALLIGCAIGGTMAWLITQSNQIENVFAPGNIEISMKEHALNPETGAWVGNDVYTPTGNKDVELLPGRSIHKDPTVTVHKGSAKCYVRVFMVVDYTIYADREFTADELASGWFHFNTDKGWFPGKRWEDVTNNNVLGHVYEMRYNTAVDASETNVELPATLYRIDIPATLSQSEFESLEDCCITFFAQAVQADGFEEESNPMNAAFAAAGLPDITINRVDGTTMTLEKMIENLDAQQATP